MIYKIKEFIRKLRYAWQRATRGYDDLAQWNYFEWFANMSHKIIKNMAQNHCGYPHGLTDEEWTKILERMAFLFHEIDEDMCSMKNEYEDKYFELLSQRQIVDKRWAPLSTTPEELKENYYRKNQEIFEYRDKCKDEALDLLKKYFWNLWD